MVSEILVQTACALILFVPVPACVKEASENEAFTGIVGCRLADFQRETESRTPGPALQVGEKVYLLIGNVTKRSTNGEEWTIEGRLLANGRTIEVERMWKCTEHKTRNIA